MICYKWLLIKFLIQYTQLESSLIQKSSKLLTRSNRCVKLSKLKLTLCLSMNLWGPILFPVCLKSLIMPSHCFSPNCNSLPSKATRMKNESLNTTSFSLFSISAKAQGTWWNKDYHQNWMWSSMLTTRLYLRKTRDVWVLDLGFIQMSMSWGLRMVLRCL